MSWQSPIKTAKICFFRTGRQLDHYMMTEDDSAAHKLLSFLIESDAVILSLENFSESETRLLKESRHKDGRSIFATSACFGLDKAIQGEKCARFCTFNAPVNDD
jgi:hypothetical protein